MFKCIFVHVGDHDNVKPWDFLKAIPVLCVLTDADAASRRSTSSAKAITGMALEWA